MPKPVGERVLIKLDKPEEKAKDSLILSMEELAPEKPTTGVVAFIGDDCKLLKVGDKVLLGESYPPEIKVQKEKYILMSEKGVLVVLD